jgi:O-antigen chain-terminating methyltransferase
MNGMQASEIDLDRIMQRIREEVARRKVDAGEKLEAMDTSAPAAPAAASSEPVALPRLPESAGRIERKAAYHLADFLGFHDEDFVRNAYLGILRREPDAGGMTSYLAELRAGRMAKTEILGRLRFSAEGRAARVPVRGLVLPFALRTARRIPIAGQLIGIVQYMIRLPLLVRNHEHLEAAFFHRQLELKRQVNVVEAHIERALARIEQSVEMRLVESGNAAKADVGRVERRVIESAYAAKTDVGRVERHIIESGNAAKAALEQLRREMLEELAEVAPGAKTDVLLAKDDRLLDPLYLSFEDRFRGTREDIKKRVEIYLPVVRQAAAGTAEAPILDIGCGRGEWLELLKENGLAGLGVDLNHVMASDCRGQGLQVIEQDAIDFLRNARVGAFGAVTGFHIIEHLPFRRLVALIDATLRALRPGGVAIFETPNPENLIVGACTFYSDFTHIAPLPPEPVAFLLSSRGFARVEIRRLHRNVAAAVLARDEVPLHPRLNDLLYGEQDYAAIAHKL